VHRGRIISIERSKGYGFIEADDGRQVFFHQRWLRKVKFKDLEEGQEVAFSVNMGSRGPRAYNMDLADNVDLETVATGRRGDELFKD
jgi:CspA family cold shock protein